MVMPVTVLYALEKEGLTVAVEQAGGSSMWPASISIRLGKFRLEVEPAHGADRGSTVSSKLEASASSMLEYDEAVKLRDALSQAIRFSDETLREHLLGVLRRPDGSPRTFEPEEIESYWRADICLYWDRRVPGSGDELSDELAKKLPKLLEKWKNALTNEDTKHLYGSRK